MDEFEKHLINLDVFDRNSAKQIFVTNSTVFNGNIKSITNKNIELKTKRKRPLAAAVIGLKNTGYPLPQNVQFFDPKVYIDTQELFLRSIPTCYLILGKPGSEAFSLGEALSKKLNCIHFCPKTIVNDEMDHNSSTGKCLDYNMKQNKICKYQNLLKILKMKLESPAVKHRGYIISGFPLVTTSTSPKCLNYSFHGEESIIVITELLTDLLFVAMKKKKHKKKKQIYEESDASDIDDEDEEAQEEEEQEPEEAEEEEEIKCELPKYLLNPCSDVIVHRHAYYKTRKAVLIEQTNFLFNLEMKPSIIIYLTGPDKDLIRKKKNTYINYKNSMDTSEPFITKIPTDIRWPTKYKMSDYHNPTLLKNFSSKYCCRQPFNFEENAINQMCNYRHDILPYIESKFNEFKPNHVINLDARQSVHQMMHYVMKRFHLLPIKPVIIPEPLYIEEPPEDLEEFWKNVEELNVIHSGELSFKLYPSLWYNRCPVELKKRQSKIGLPKLAVNFGKYVYLLSTLDNVVSFCRNPRPYLKLKYLEPTCRIIVIGTKSSGKTLISQCLSWLFDTAILSYDKFLKLEREKKFVSYAKTILSEIIATIEDERLAVWQTNENSRLTELDKWNKKVMPLVQQYIPLLVESFKYKEREPLVAEQSRQESVASFVNEEEDNLNIQDTIPEKPPIPSPEFLEKFGTLKTRLAFLPVLDDLDFFQHLLDNKTAISTYAPLDLTTPIPKPKVPMLGDDDVMIAINKYITANELEKEIEPTTEELMTQIISYLTKIDSDVQTATNFNTMYGKYIIDGFPSNPEYWDFLSESKVMPDYTIALVENREIDDSLIDYYNIINSAHKNHSERFTLANDPLMEAKILSKPKPNTAVLDVKIIINEAIKALFDTIFNTTDNSKDNPGADDVSPSFSEAVERFKENWDTTKLKVEQYDKCHIEVELEDKSDIQVVEDVLLKLRQSYMEVCEPNEEEGEPPEEDEDERAKDLLTFNDPRNLCDTNIYCPIAYHDHGVLWAGKPEFGITHYGVSYNFCKEEALQKCIKDIAKYQSFNKTHKSLPPLRICVIGCIGSGKTTLSKLLSKELGLVHIDFAEAINDFLVPRHFKRVGRRYENSFTDPFDDEAVTEFQMDEGNENLISDLMSDENELRHMVHNYFDRGAQIIPPLMEKLIKLLWFKEPFVKSGFILDGYPRLPLDVEDMINTFCIPDLVIELEGNSDVTQQRVVPKMLKTWKDQLQTEKNKQAQKLEEQRKDWVEFMAKMIVPKLILDEVLENMFFVTIGSEEKIPTLDSAIIDAHPSGSKNVDANLFKMYNELIEDYPPPFDENEWEKADEVREKIETRIESIYETDDENVQALKDILIEQRIKTMSIDGTKSIEKMLRLTLSKLSNLRSRNESFFEQTYIVSTDVAEVLLQRGFCFLSRFGHNCPVYVYENPNAIQSNYKPGKSKIYPIIHRDYIYYNGDRNAVRKFRTNPLKYTLSNSIAQFIEYPLRISVIGNPKSGKSSLAAKIANIYGLICISRGMAARHILDDMSWTELGTKMYASASSGECISEDHIVKAIQTTAIDYRTTTYGFVFDGFPETASEAMELCKDGLYPNIVFDIRSKDGTVLESSQLEVNYDILKYKPPYSRPFIQNRCKKWSENSYKIRNWINNDYQNIYVLDGNQSLWQCLADATKVINNKFIPEAHHYLTHVENNAVKAHVMCISNEIFSQRKSCYKNFCPLCLSDNVLKHSDYPVDKRGVVQYMNKFFWVCARHMNDVLRKPQNYLLTEKVTIPEVPAIVKNVHMDLLHENGICIVHYAEKLPSQIIIRGTNKHAASFKDKIYMFCSDKCLTKFLAKPNMYADITQLKNKKTFPPLSLNKLPNLGYLEQTLGNVITEACCYVNVVRPKYPGLNYKLSALLHIALYLKTHNPRTDKGVLPKYVKASNVFDARCKMVTHIGLVLRSMDNPFASYPVCCKGKAHRTSLKGKNSTSSGTVRKPSSFDLNSHSSASITDFKQDL